jgi:hypothetical protein
VLHDAEGKHTDGCGASACSPERQRGAAPDVLNPFRTLAMNVAGRFPICAPMTSLAAHLSHYSFPNILLVLHIMHAMQYFSPGQHLLYGFSYLNYALLSTSVRIAARLRIHPVIILIRGGAWGKNWRTLTLIDSSVFACMSNITLKAG